MIGFNGDPYRGRSRSVPSHNQECSAVLLTRISHPFWNDLARHEFILMAGGRAERGGGGEEGSGSFSSNLRKLKQTSKNVVARFSFGWF